MRTTLVTLSLCLLPALAIAQDPNARARATHSLEFPNAGKITVAYHTLDLQQGDTFKSLTSGENPNLDMFNEKVIPMRIEGNLELGAATTLGGKQLAQGKYRFTFRVADGTWSLVVYEDTGKKTEGQRFQDITTYNTKEKEVAAIALDLKDDAKSMSKRLTIVPVAGEQAGQGSLNVRFGAAEARVPFTVGGGAAAKPMDSASQKGGAEAGKSGNAK